MQNVNDIIQLCLGGKGWGLWVARGKGGECL